jgi:hypothetical protein
LSERSDRDHRRSSWGIPDNGIHLVDTLVTVAFWP